MTDPNSFVVNDKAHLYTETPDWFPEPTFYPTEEVCRARTIQGGTTTDGERFYIGTADGVAVANEGDTIVYGEDKNLSVRPAS